MERNRLTFSVLALGGEGNVEERGAVQVNLPCILDDDFVCSADGTARLDKVKEAGPVVVSDSFELPFARGSFDRIVARSVPVCKGKKGKQNIPDSHRNPPRTRLGRIYCLERVKELLSEGGVLDIGDECWIDNF
jgi:hypothetical protein